MHFPGFESLRALAAAMVVVHHGVALSGPARAGRLATPAEVLDGGVAVFFVLSGFLIYRPFVAGDLVGRVGRSLVSFWWRRVLRVVPAYWLALSFFWFLGSFDLGPQWWRYYLFLQIYAPETVLGGVVQAWSLCTEMTFYLLVPLWAALVRRLVGPAGGARAAAGHAAGVVVLFLAGPASRAAIEAWAPGRRGLSFNWLPTNLDLFATGMGLAVLSAWAAHHPGLRDRLDRLARRAWPWWLTAWALLGVYAYRVGAADFATGYAGWFWHRRQLTLVLFSLLLLVPSVFGDQQHGMVRRVLRWRPLVWIGGVSYGLYLWHFDWMERAVDFEGRSGWVRTPAGDSSLGFLLAVGFGVGLLCAAASWYLVEEPLQRFKDLFERRRRSTAGALGGDGATG